MQTQGLHVLVCFGCVCFAARAHREEKSVYFAYIKFSLCMEHNSIQCYKEHIHTDLVSVPSCKHANLWQHMYRLTLLILVSLYWLNWTQHIVQWLGKHIKLLKPFDYTCIYCSTAKALLSLDITLIKFSKNSMIFKRHMINWFQWYQNIYGNNAYQIFIDHKNILRVQYVVG